MNTNLPEITEDQYLVLEFIPDGIEKRRINSQYEPRIQYVFKSPAKNMNSAYKAAFAGSKKRIVMNIGDIRERGNPQEIFVEDAIGLLGLVAGGRSLFRVLVFDNPVEETVEETVEEVAVEPIVYDVVDLEEIVGDIIEEPVSDEIEEEVETKSVLSANVSIAEMKKVIANNDLDTDDITTLIEQEESGKNRNGMLKLLEGQL